MALSKRSLNQAKEVLKQIYDSNVNAIVTRATLDKKIEQVKFPYLKVTHEKFYKEKNLTAYANQQYNPIRYWLIDNWFLTSEKINGIYTYYVNRRRIGDYLSGIIEIPQEKVKRKSSTKNQAICVPAEEYNKMCKMLSHYGVTSDTLDKRATEIHQAGNDVVSSYNYALYDLLEECGGITEKKSNDPVVADVETKYAVVSEYSVLEGILTKSELEMFFSEDRDVNKYMVFEAGKAVNIQKKVTTSITIE